MANMVTDKGIITLSGKISKDKINLVSDAVTPLSAEMVWTTFSAGSCRTHIICRNMCR